MQPRTAVQRIHLAQPIVARLERRRQPADVSILGARGASHAAIAGSHRGSVLPGRSEVDADCRSCHAWSASRWADGLTVYHPATSSRVRRPFDSHPQAHDRRAHYPRARGAEAERLRVLLQHDPRGAHLPPRGSSPIGELNEAGGSALPTARMVKESGTLATTREPPWRKRTHDPDNLPRALPSPH